VTPLKKKLNNIRFKEGWGGGPVSNVCDKRGKKGQSKKRGGGGHQRAHNEDTRKSTGGDLNRGNRPTYKSASEGFEDGGGKTKEEEGRGYSLELNYVTCVETNQNNQGKTTQVNWERKLKNKVFVGWKKYKKRDGHIKQGVYRKPH